MTKNRNGSNDTPSEIGVTPCTFLPQGIFKMENATASSLPRLVGEFHGCLQKSLFRSLGDAVFDLRMRNGSGYLQDFERRLEELRLAFPEKPWPEWAVNGYINLNKA